MRALVFVVASAVMSCGGDDGGDSSLKTGGTSGDAGETQRAGAAGSSESSSGAEERGGSENGGTGVGGHVIGGSGVGGLVSHGGAQGQGGAPGVGGAVTETCMSGVERYVDLTCYEFSLGSYWCGDDGMCRKCSPGWLDCDMNKDCESFDTDDVDECCWYETYGQDLAPDVPNCPTTS